MRIRAFLTRPTRLTRRLPHLVLVSALALSAASTSAQTVTQIPGPNGTVMVTSSPAATNPNAPQPTGTGRIRGRVVDAETGAALQDALMRLEGGGLRPVPTGTDENGRFEFENLPVGRFTITGMKPGYMTLAYGQRRPFENGRQIELADKQILENIDLAVPRGGVIVARVTDENGEPFSGARIAAQRYRFAGGQQTLSVVATPFDVTDDRGEIRVYGLPPGEYYVSTAAVGFGAGAAANGTSYVPTFYPGTASVGDAQRVTVEISKEVQVSFSLVASRMSRVSGTVRRADGSPAVRATSVSVIPSRTSAGGVSRGAAVQPNGTFTINDVPPGEYTLQASSGTVQQIDRELGRVPLSMSGKDVTGISVAMTTGATVRGRIAFEPSAPANVRLATLIPFVTPGPVLAGTPNTQDDGTFAIGGIFDPGVIRFANLPTGWFLKSVRADGKDVTDVPITVDPGRELTGVEVLLTQKRAEISGTANDAKGAPSSDYAVVVFPEDRTLWTIESRFIASGRPDQQGRFRIPGLPPGKYLAAAVDYVEIGSERDPELLERLRERSTPVTVAEGETKAVTLSVQ